jgi:hypothetical protein
VPKTLVPRTLKPRILVPRTLKPRMLVPRTLKPRILVPRTLVIVIGMIEVGMKVEIEISTKGKEIIVKVGKEKILMIEGEREVEVVQGRRIVVDRIIMGEILTIKRCVEKVLIQKKVGLSAIKTAIKIKVARKIKIGKKALIKTARRRQSQGKEMIALRMMMMLKYLLVR